MPQYIEANQSKISCRLHAIGGSQGISNELFEGKHFLGTVPREQYTTQHNIAMLQKNK